MLTVDDDRAVESVHILVHIVETCIYVNIHIGLRIYSYGNDCGDMYIFICYMIGLVGLRPESLMSTEQWSVYMYWCIL